jgi:hypothetical protein
MRIFVRTIIWLWATVATVYVAIVEPAPWWIRIGVGLGGGAALGWLVEAILNARAPKVARKGYPTTSR